MSDLPPPVVAPTPEIVQPTQDPILLQQQMQQREQELRQQEEERKRVKFLEDYKQVLQADPEIKMRAFRYAQQMRVDPATIESNLSFAEQFVKQEAMARSQIQRTNPNLFRMLGNKDLLAQTYDDIAELQKTDSTWGSIKRQVYAGHDTNVMSYYGLLRILSADGNLSPEDQQEYDKLQASVAVAQTSDSFAAASGRLLGQMWPSVAVGAGTVLAAPATGGTSVVAGSALGAAMNGLLMAGETYNQARQEGLTHEQAAIAATTTGAITGYLGGKVFKSFVEPYLPTMSQVFGRGAAAAVVSGSVSRATANALWNNMLRQSVKGYAVENVQELAETVTQWTAIQTFKEGGFSAEERAKLFDELKAVAAETSKGMALIAPVGPLANALVQSRYVAQARSVKAGFDRLVESASKSKTTARDPNVAAVINDTLAQEVGVEIDPKAFEEAILAAENKQLEKLAADQKITVEQLRAGMATPSPVMADLATKIPNLMDRLQKARDEGVDLRLSAGEWGTHLLGSEVGKDLSFHARMEGQTLSLNEALIVDKLSQQYIDEGKDLLKKTHLDNMEIVRQARQVKAAFKQQIMDAGRSQAEAEANAELIKVFTVAAGLRVGKKPVEFMRSPEFALAVESAGLGRLTPREPVAEPGQAPFSPVQPAGRPPADLTQPLSTIDSEAFGGQPGVAIAPKDLLDATKVEEVLGKVKERLTRTVNEAKKDEMGISAADLSGQAEPLLADVEKLSARLLELQGKTPGQKAIMQTAEPYVAEGTQASADIQALEKKLEDMIANPPPKPEAEATVFPNGRDKATAKEQKAYDRTVKAYQKHQDQIKSMRGKLAAAKATVSAAEANVQDVAQKVDAIAPVPFGGRDIAAEIVQAKQQLAQMKKTGSPEADIKAQADWIKQAEQYERQSIARKLPVSGGEMLDQDVAQMDADYLAAVERGDMETAQRMVDEAAKAAGLDVVRVYHGTKKEFTSFDPSVRDPSKLSYFSYDKEFARSYATGIGGHRTPEPAIVERIQSVKNLSKQFFEEQYSALIAKYGSREQTPDEEASALLDKARDYERSLLDGMTVFDAEREMGVRVLELYLDTGRVFNPRKQWSEFVPEILEYLKASSWESLRPDMQQHVKNGNYMIWEAPNVVNAVLEKYDSILLQESTISQKLDTIAVRDSRRIKSADPVTRDASGNVIPLSQRFDVSKPSFLYQQDLDPEDQLERDDLQKLEQILFHGTPWIWEPEPGYPFGRPRLDKLGSGEGVAAYGWGFYTTAVESVANDYRAKEYQIVSRVTIDGQPIAKLFDTVTQDDIAVLMAAWSPGRALNRLSLRANAERARADFDLIFSEAERADYASSDEDRQDAINTINRLLYVNNAWWAENGSLSYQFRLGKMIGKSNEFKKEMHDKTNDALVDYLLALKKFGKDNGLINSRNKFNDLDALETALTAFANKASVAAKQKALLMWYIPSHRDLALDLGWDFMDKVGGVPIKAVPDDLRLMWEQHGRGIYLKPGATYKWDVPDFSFVDWSSEIRDQPVLEQKLSEAFGTDIANYHYYGKRDVRFRIVNTGNELHHTLNVMGMLGALPNQQHTQPIHYKFADIVNNVESILRDFIPQIIDAAFSDSRFDSKRDEFNRSVKSYAHMAAYNLLLAQKSSVAVADWSPEDYVSYVISNVTDRLFPFYNASIDAKFDVKKAAIAKPYLDRTSLLVGSIKSIEYDLRSQMNETWTPAKKLTAEFLLSLGYSGMRYEAGLLSGAGHIGSGDFNYVIWDQKVLDSMAMISRNEELMADFRKVYESIQNGTRRGEFDPATGVIMLLKDADSSTLTHELAHWMLESMGKMAMDPNADQSLRDDMGALLSWFGIKDGADGRPALDIWMNSPLSDRREGHERFAISFEDWLLKGIAPTKGLSRLFDQMRYMMIKAYGDVYNPLNEAYKRRFGKDLPAMTPEVKEVYTRLIDADQQMDEAEAAADMLPRFTTKEQWIKNGGDDAGWAEYQQALTDARADAKADITQQSQKAMAYLVRAEAAYLRDIQKQYDAEYEKTSVEVEKELRGKTEYKLLDFLSKGVVMDEDGKPIESTRREVHRLDRDKVVAIMTGKTATEIKNWMQELVAAGLDLTNVQRFIRRDGLDPTEVANQFGYQNATQMLSILRDTKPLAEAVANETAARMQKKDGFIDVKNAPMKVVAPLVAKALHNKARMKFVAIEIGALIKSQQPVKILNAAAAQGATSKLREMRLGEVLPNKSKQAARRFRSLTMMHLAKAESEQAAKAAEQELLYTHLHEQQLDFQDFLKKAQERMKSWSRPDKDIVRTRDIDIVNAGRAIMAHFGMYSGEASFSPDKLLSDLERLHPHVYHNLKPLIVKAGMYRQRMEMANRPSKSMPYNLLTVDEFKIVMAQLDGLWDTAKEVRMAEIEGKRMTLDQQEEEIVGQIAANGVPTPPPGTKTWWERNMQSFGVKIGHFTTRLEHYFKFMDNGVVGAFTKYLWRPMNEASQKYQDMMVQYCKRYADLLRKVDMPDGQIIATELQVRDPSNPNGTTPFIFGRGSNQGKAELLKLMLNMGNASNRKYAMKGFKFNPAQFDAFVQRMFKEGVLTDADLDFMQSVFDLTEELGVQANDAFKQMHGYKVDMIPPTEIVNPETGKRIKGGYIPIVADKWVAPRVNLDKDTGEIDLDGFSNVMSDMIPSVQSNFLKERTEREFPPLDLSLSGLAGHIENVVRFVSVAPSLKQVRSLLRRTEVQNALKAHDPDVINRLIKPWLVRTANQSVGNGGAPGYWNGAIWRNLRVGSTALAMATNVAAMLQNVFGLLPAARQVGYTNLLRSAWSIMQAPADSKKFIFENSKYLSQSARDGMYEVMSYIHSQGKVGKFTKFSNKVHQHLFLLQTITQTPVDMVVWNARYQQVLSELSPSMDYEAAHKEASEQADALVRTTQNANRPVDVAQSETGPDALRLLTSLTGWFTNMVNLNRFEAQRILRDEVGWSNKSTQYLHLFLSSAVGTVVLGSLVADAYYGKGAFDDDDEEKDALLLAIRSAYGMVKAAAAPLPGVSQLSRGLENLWFDDNIINDKLPVSPGVDMLFNAIRRASNSDEFFSMTNIDTFADLITLLSGGRIPANWVTDPLNKVLGEKK